MVDQQIINMLDDPNPQVRTNAVKQLARMQSQEAVQYLAAVYKTDDDPEVRELARKAGLYIKKKMTEDNWTGGEGMMDDDPEPEPEVEDIQVSARAVQSSKGLMDSAMELHLRGDEDKAAQFVEKAFLTNPNLKNDPYYLQSASSILGVPEGQVVTMLLGDVDYSGGKAKRKRKNREDDVSTEAVIIDLLIYWIVLAAILIIGTLIQFQFLSSIMDTMMASPEFASELSAAEAAEAEAQIAMFMNVFVGAGLVATVIYSIIASFFSVIILLVQYAFIHFSATSILSGEGTYKGLIHKLTNFFTAMYAIFTIIGYVMAYLMIMSFVEIADPSAGGGGASGLLSLVSFGYFVAAVIALFWMGRLIGKNYEFGTGKGCISVIISSILMGAVACACSFVFSAVLGNMMTSMMMSNGGF